MGSKNSLISKLARNLDATGDITADAIASTVSLGAKIYASRANLPSSGNTAGDQAYVTDNNRLYIWNGSGWYNIALLNVAPAISSVTDSDGGVSPFTLSTTGAVTTITITAADSDGDPITYSASADSNFSGLATVSQADNVFTITPFSQDSATTTSGTITFTATDGVNVASSGIQTFTLNFLSPYWDETVLSIGTSSTNSLDNSTFIDRSTNAYTVTPTGSPTQTAFHPYLDNWSLKTETGNIYVNSSFISSTTSTFTAEAWVNMTSYPIVPDGGTSEHGSVIVLDGDKDVVTMYMSFGIDTSGKLVLFWYSAGSYKALVDTALNIGQWYHIAASVNNNAIKLFIDGIEQTITGTSTLTNRSGQHNQATIGGNTTDQSAFQGYISDARVSSDALYSGDFTPPTEPLSVLPSTIVLAGQDNRFIDKSGNYTFATNGTISVSAHNPFGQGSEYALGENKGSVKMTDTIVQYLTTPQTAALSSTLLANNFTTEAWIYLESFPSVGAAHIWNNSEAHSDGQTALYIYADGRIMFGKVGVNEVGSTTGTIKLGTWHHVAMVRNGATTRIYVDGADVANGASSTYLNASNVKHMKIGRSSQTSGDNSFPGYISDFKVTASAVYTSAFTPPTSPAGSTNAELYLPMDNAGIYDKTGNSTLTLGGNATTSTTQNKFADTSMYFDGNGDTVKFPSPVFTNQDFTMEFWLYTTQTSSTRILGNLNTAWSTNDFVISLNDTSGKIGMYIHNYNTSSEILTSTTSVNDGSWHHIAYTRSGSNWYLLIDGTIESTRSSSISFGDSSADIITFGWDGYSGTWFNGYIENFQILKGVAKYTANFTLPTQTQGRNYQAES